MTAHKILMIDDERDLCDLARMGMEMSNGWTVRTAHSGQSGVAAAQADPPDAILLDLTMPDMDGRAALELLKADERTRQVPVLLMTARTHDPQFNELGISGFIPKPFNALTLGDEVARTLGW